MLRNGVISRRMKDVSRIIILFRWSWIEVFILFLYAPQWDKHEKMKDVSFIIIILGWPWMDVVVLSPCSDVDNHGKLKHVSPIITVLRCS